jgi:hypothetical protein
MKGITRNSNSWIARIYRNGKSISTSFADVTYGGRDQALDAAEKFLENLNKTLPAAEPQERLLKNNKTGKTGVSKSHTYGGSGNKLPCYIATWVGKDGKQRHKNFIYQEGDDASENQAFQKACSARDEAERE